MRKYLTSVISLLVMSSSAFAGSTYSVGTAYPGMTADQAKAAGFTICEKSKNGLEVICQKKDAPKESAGIPVESFSVSFSAPFDKVQTVIWKIGDTRKKTKACRPTKGQWGDVVSGDCAIDVRQKLIDRMGPPIKSNKHSDIWHKCDLDIFTYSKRSGTITISEVHADWRGSQIQECEIFKRQQDHLNKEAAAKQQKARESDAFINKMK